MEQDFAERLPEFPEYAAARSRALTRPPRAIATESALIGGLVLDALSAPFWLVLLLLGKARLASAARPLRRVVSFLVSARMTAALVVANAAVFAWQVALLARGLPADELRRLFALAPSDLARGNYPPLFLHAFAHAGVAHLCGNMFALFVFGRVVERHLGPWRMLAAYLGSAAVSTVISLGATVAAGQDTASLGASGAVAGMIALGILFEPFTLTYEALLPMPLFILGWVAAAGDVSGILSGRQDGIDHAAHLGGYLSVLVLYFGLSAPLRRCAKVGLLLNLATAVVAALVWILWLGPALAVQAR